MRLVKPRDLGSQQARAGAGGVHGAREIGRAHV